MTHDPDMAGTASLAARVMTLQRRIDSFRALEKRGKLLDWECAELVGKAQREIDAIRSQRALPLQDQQPAGALESPKPVAKSR